MSFAEQNPNMSPSNYLLPPDICLTFIGEDYLARQAIEFMFDYCQKLPETEIVNFHQVRVCITINHDYLSSPLPDWIDRQVSARPKYDHVHAFYGPEGEAATLLSNRDGFVCGVLNGAGNRIDITLGKVGSSKATMMSPSAIFTPLIQEVFQRRNNLIFHSAGLQLPDGKGIMIIADSGGGKTTTALALLRKNAVMLADDLVILTREDNKALMYGIPEPLNLTPATIEFFPELKDARSLPSRDGVTNKVVFDPRSVYGSERFGGNSPLHAIYFIEVTPGRPALNPLPPQAALGKLIKACTFAFHQKLTRNTGAGLLDLATRIPCFVLRTGSDPDFLGSWLQNEGSADMSGQSGNSTKACHDGPAAH